MPRSTGSTATRRRRKKVLKLAKGYYGSKHKLFKVANQQVMKSYNYAYRDRRKKNANSVNYGLRVSMQLPPNGLSYSRLMHGLKVAGIEVNRKMLADLAIY